MKNAFRIIVLVVWVAWNSPVAASTISDINLNEFDFDVVNYDVGSVSSGLAGDATASGTSNGVGWSISPTNLWSARTTTNGSFNFSSLPHSTDNLHPSIDFTITFDQMVGTLLVALSNNDLLDSINFGVVPSDFLGVSVSGTQIILNTPSGGLALFENVNSFTISHTDNNGITDGFDLAFYVVPPNPVPVPAAIWLLGSGLVGLIGLKFKKNSLKSV